MLGLIIFYLSEPENERTCLSLSPSVRLRQKIVVLSSILSFLKNSCFSLEIYNQNGQF